MENIALIEAVAVPVLDRHDCQMVQATFRRERAGRVLRLLVERRGTDPDQGSGVDHTLCAEISRDLGAVIDVEDLIKGAYTMEVSSAGLERPLTKLEDYNRFVGRTAAITTADAIAGRRRFKGVLKGIDAGVVVLRASDGKSVTIPADSIKKANLVFEMNSLGLQPGVK